MTLLESLHAGVGYGFDIARTATFVLSSLYCLMTVVTLALSRRRPRAHGEITPDRLPLVTVQIPTYNELAVLNCASRCLAFDYPADRLQILIGDDSNRPDVSAQIDQFCAEHPRISICRRGNNAGYKPGNLNHMLLVTRGDYILVLDSDFLPERDFLRRLVVPVVENPDLAGVQASWLVTNVAQNYTTLVGAGIINVIHKVLLPFISRSTGSSVFCGSAELVRRDVLAASGGWRPGALTEDVDYSMRLMAAGRRIVYLEDLFCACEVPHTPRDLFRQQMRWAYGVMRVFINHGRKLLLSRLARVRVKLAAACFVSGYVMIGLFIVTAVLGVLDLLGTGQPALQEAASWVDRVADTSLNILLTCGLLVSSLFASLVAGFSLRNSGKLVVASFTIGVVLVFFVGKGLAKALLGLPMQWFMVRKNGNTVRLNAPA